MEDFFSNLHIGEQSKKINKEIDREPYKIIESQRYEKIKNSWKKFNSNPKHLWLTRLTGSTEAWKRSNIEDLKELKSQITDFYQTNTCRKGRVSVQGVKSLGGHFACLCRGLNFMK